MSVQLWSVKLSAAAAVGILFAGSMLQLREAPRKSAVPQLSWQFDTGGAVSAEPVPSGALLFVVSDSGKIYALNRETGKEVWVYDFRPDGVTVSLGAPLLHGDTVIVGVTGKDCESNQRGYVYSLEQQTGRLVWKTGVPGVRTKLVQIDKAAVFGTGQDEWISVDLMAGKLNWKFGPRDPQRECYANSSPATDGVDIVVATHDRKLHGLDGMGRQLWEKLARANVSTNPFVYKDVAYFGARNNHVYGVDPATGKTLVDLAAPGVPEGDFIWGEVGGDYFVYSLASVDRNGLTPNLLLAYSDEFEKVVWSQRLDGELICRAPYYWQGLVLAGNCKGQIMAYRANDGHPLWEVGVEGCIRTIAGDRSAFFVGVETGKLFSFDSPPADAER
jgi:outer membrane protein assembly factor BamB